MFQAHPEFKPATLACLASLGGIYILGGLLFLLGSYLDYRRGHVCECGQCCEWLDLARQALGCSSLCLLLWKVVNLS